MSLKLIFSLLFLFLLTYSFIRPFSSIFSKLFLMIGSGLGLLSIMEANLVNDIATFFGIGGGGKDLFLYISFVTIFLVILYISERFKILENRVALLTRGLALEKAKNESLREKVGEQ